MVPPAPSVAVLKESASLQRCAEAAKTAASLAIRAMKSPSRNPALQRWLQKTSHFPGSGLALLGGAYGLGTGYHRNHDRPSRWISPGQDALKSGAWVGGGSALLTYLLNRHHPQALADSGRFGLILGAGVGLGAGIGSGIAKARSRTRETFRR